MGSLRAIATALDAHLGDTLVFVFNVRDSTVAVKRVAKVNGADRLAALIGGPVAPSPRAALARAFGCDPDELDGLLQRRGEADHSPGRRHVTARRRSRTADHLVGGHTPRRSSRSERSSAGVIGEEHVDCDATGLWGGHEDLADRVRDRLP